MHIFASDYDGTLFKGQTITEKDLNAIKKFRDAGHKFGIVTGRSIDSIVTEINMNQIPFDFLVGINGGIVLDHELSEINAHKMDDTIIMDLLKCIDDFGVLRYGVNDGYFHTSVSVEDLKNNINLEEFQRVIDNGLSGLYIATHSNEDTQELTEIINKRFKKNGVLGFANEKYIDIGTVNNSKTTGILDVMKHYGYQGHVFTVGDSYNDVPMIRDFYGYLMENGVASLSKFAKGGVVETVSDAIEDALQEIEKR